MHSYSDEMALGTVVWYNWCIYQNNRIVQICSLNAIHVILIHQVSKYLALQHSKCLLWPDLVDLASYWQYPRRLPSWHSQLRSAVQSSKFWPRRLSWENSMRAELVFFRLYISEWQYEELLRPRFGWFQTWDGENHKRSEAEACRILRRQRHGHLLGRVPKDVGESQPLHFDCVHA